MAAGSRNPEETRTSRWLRDRRLKIAAGIAVVEGLIVALEDEFSRWTVVVIAAPIIAFYLFAGRALESDTGRQVAWIAAASQSMAVLFVILAFVLKALALVAVGVLAAAALYLLLRDRPSSRA